MQSFNKKKTDLYQMRNKSFKFSQTGSYEYENHMTSQILLDAQVFCPTNYADLAIFKPLTLEREEILRSSKLYLSQYNMVFHVRQ